MRIGNIEMRGFSMETPQGPVKLAAIRFNLENGKVGEFAFEGLDAVSPKGPIKVARFALKSIDLANLLRMSALYANPAQRPSPDQALAMLTLLEGIEVKGLVAPFREHQQIDHDRQDQFGLGTVCRADPEAKRRLTAKLTSADRREQPRLQVDPCGRD